MFRCYVRCSKVIAKGPQCNSAHEKSIDFKFLFRSLDVGIDKCKLETIMPNYLMAGAAASITIGFQDILNHFCV